MTLRDRLTAHIIALVLLCGLAAMPATAQSMDYGVLEHLFKGPVTTSATGSPQRATDVPVNMIIVTADEIRRSGARDIPGVLRHVAGVDVMQWAKDNTDVSLRGYDQAFSARTLVLIDGRQVYADYYGFVPWSSLPVELSAIRQIEVVKGPNSALFGFNAAGGVINIITYNPQYDDILTLQTEAGTQGLASVSGVGTLHLGGDGAIRLSAGYRRDNDFGSPIPPAMAGVSLGINSRFAADVKAVYAFDKVSLEFEGSHSDVVQTEVSPDYAMQRSHYGTNSLLGRVTADSSAGLLYLSAYSNWISWSGLPNPILGKFDVMNQVTVVEAGDSISFGTDHTVRIASSYRHNSVNTTPLSGGTVDYDVFSGSSAWTWQIFADLALTNAVRLDHLTLHRGGGVPVGYPFGNMDWNRSLDEWSFNSGLVWSATASDSVRLMASRGAQLPSLVDFGAVLIASPYVHVSGVPSLAPTTITNVEVAWDRNFPELAVKTQVALFHQKTDHIVSVGGSFIMTPLAPYATPMNIGSSEADGLNIIVSGHLAAHWTWSASYRAIAIKDDFVSVAAGGIDFVDYEHTTPKHVVKANLGWASGSWEADAYLHYQSSTSGLRLSLFNTTPVPIGDFASVDARIAYQITDWATLSLSGVNLLQERQRQTSGPDVEREMFLRLDLHG